MNFSSLFDDIVKDEYGTWTQICKIHAKSLEISSLGQLEDCPSKNIICGCIDCHNKAEYYLDFSEE